MKYFFYNQKFTITASVLIFVLFVSLTSLTPVVSQSSQDYNQLINQKNAELQESAKSIQELEKKLDESKNFLAQTQEGLPMLEAQIENLENQVALNSAKLDKLNQDIQINTLQLEFLNKTQKQSVKSSYISWRALPDQNLFNTDIRTDFLVNQQYSHEVLGFGNSKVESIAFLINKLEGDKLVSKKLAEELSKQNQELVNKKLALEEQIRNYSANIAGSSTQIAYYKDQQQSINKQISELLVEQKKAAEREAWILQQQNQTNPGTGGGSNNGGGNNSGQQSTFKFTGIGRDLYQGHGVGMSQWGAHGMGLNGFSAQQILTTYYSGVNISGGYENSTINVSGYGNINIENYAAGQAEVPSRACGNPEQVAARPDKYVLDNPSTSWDCWPEETIKAQVIAFRTYGLHYVNFKSGTICATAACQVYNGSQSSRWAVDETRGQVILSGGRLIEALYSSDNSQGYGTAHNDTIFQNLWGDGTPYSYLRAVNDSQWASRTSWTSWSYATGNYTGDEIIQMLRHISNDAGYSASIRSSLQDIINSLGNNIATISFERDPSQRVKKIFFTSSNGVTRSLGGWWFKNFWNSWSYDIGRYDYIYSQTFF